MCVVVCLTVSVRLLPDSHVVLQRLDGVQLVCNLDDGVDHRAEVSQFGNILLLLARLGGVVQDEEGNNLGSPAAHGVVEADDVLARLLGGERHAALGLVGSIVLLVEVGDLLQHRRAEGVVDLELDVEEAASGHLELQAEILAALQILEEALLVTRLNLSEAREKHKRWGRQKEEEEKKRRRREKKRNHKRETEGT